MKRIIRYNVLLIFFICTGLYSTAQNIPTPAVWFNFDYSPWVSWKKSAYNNTYLNEWNARRVYLTEDRFGAEHNAGDFWSGDRQSTMVITDTNNIKENVKLFGYSNQSANLPDNFTISCWVYVDPNESPLYARKIFYTDFGPSRFALIHKGSNIYLRRAVPNDQTLSYHTFDYLFGAPASFDAGANWYQVILVMGRRSDNAKYCKLYIGKPSQVKYDATGPRKVTNPSDVLASDFGGAYAFTGVQDFMNSNVTEWGLGNADANDPVHGQLIAPVMRLDDFAVWNFAFTDEQARSMFYCQRSTPANNCWASPARLSAPVKKTAIADSVATSEIKNISVYPNPTSGELWVQLPADNTGSNGTLSLTDLNGKLIYTRTLVGVDKTGQTLHLNVKSLVKASGIYMLQVTIAGKTQAFKVIVQ